MHAVLIMANQNAFLKSRNMTKDETEVGNKTIANVNHLVNHHY